MISAVAVAAPGDILFTFNDPTPLTGGEFGYAACILNGNIAIGAPSELSFPPNSPGEVQVFNGSTGAWMFTVPNPAPVNGDGFGHSVSAIGANLLIGAPYDSAGASKAGSAYIMNGATGALIQTFNNPSAAANDYFGWEADAVGGRVAVGSPNDATAGPGGAAFVFDGSTGALQRTLGDPNAPPAALEEYGLAMAALDSTRILIGNPGSGAGDDGIAYVYDATTGALLRTIVNPDPTYDRFGQSVAATSSRLLVGADSAAYLFDASTGALLRTFFHPTLSVTSQFGDEVIFLAGDVAISAPSDPISGAARGAAYVFNPANGTLRLTIPASASDSQFGTALAELGGNLVVGAPLAGGTITGRAYLIEGPGPLNAAEVWADYD